MDLTSCLLLPITVLQGSIYVAPAIYMQKNDMGNDVNS